MVVTAEGCNVINGGLFGGNETGCGTYDPDIISNVMLPSGGIGKIYYQWMRTTDPKLPKDQWIPIFGANKETYDPGPINVTTFYARCSRKGICDEYVGETNVIIKAVEPELRLISDSIRIFNETACGLSDGRVKISINDIYEHGPWLVQLDLEGKTIFYGPFISPVFELIKLKPGSYSKLQIMNGMGCTSNIQSGELLVEAAPCNAAISPIVTLSAYPNPSSEQINLIIHLPEGAFIKSLELIETSGRVVNKPLLPKITPYFTGYRALMEVGDMNAGLYYLRLITSKGVRFAQINIVK